jgi:hypothetical protein
MRSTASAWFAFASARSPSVCSGVGHMEIV